MSLASLVRMRWLIGMLLIVAAVLFAGGVATETTTHRDTAASSVESGESGESGEHNERSEPAQNSEGAETAESGEGVLGINIESTPLVVLAIAISAALAAATWRQDRRTALLMAAMFAAAFAVLDIAELVHQVQQSAATIAVIAGAIALLHAAAAFWRNNAEPQRPEHPWLTGAWGGTVARTPGGLRSRTESS